MTDSLQAEFKRRQEHLTERSRRFNPDTDFSKFPDSLDGWVVNMVGEILPLAANRIGLEKGELEKRLIKVGAISDQRINGFTRSSDDWKTFEIGINVGLMMFFHKMNNIFASRMGVMGNDGVPISSPEMPFEEAVSVTRRLMKAFWEGKFWHEMSITIMQLSDEQVDIGAALLRNSELFVVAHEFGHIVIELSPGNITELGVGIDAAKVALTDASGLGEPKKSELINKWGKEFGADLIGLQFLLKLHNHDFTRLFAYSATELVFIMQNMLETYYRNTFRRSIPLSGHPPSWLRLDVLRFVVGKSNPPEVLHYGTRFEEIADEILSEV